MSYNEELWRKIEERERQMEQSKLLIKAIRNENKTGFFIFLNDMFCGLGIRNVFSGVADVLFITLAAAVGSLLCASGVNIAYADRNLLYGVTFAFSPAIYFLFFLLTVLKERGGGGYEIKMTCRYTVFHLCAYRMFLAGIGCLLLNAAFTAVIAGKTEAVYSELLAVSFSSLFLFALALIICLLRYGLKGITIPAAIFAAAAVACQFDGYLLFMRNVPVAAYIVLGVTAAMLFQRNLNNINRRFSYAVR